ISEVGELLRCVRLAGMVSARAHPEREAMDLAARAVIEDAQRCLSLSHPFKAIWLDGGRTRPGQLLLVAHHLVVDAVSWRILIEDLHAACVCPSDPGLAPSTSWTSWVRTLVDMGRQGHFRHELPFWQAQVAEHDAGLPGRGDQANRVEDTRTIDTTLHNEATAMLTGQVPAAYRVKVDELLLTALARTLCAWSKKDQVLVELEG